MGPLSRSLMRHGAAIVAMLALSLPAIAHGQDASVAAEALFAEGQTLMDEKNYDAACAKFKASMDAQASGGTALNLARCNQLRGRTASAWANFRRAASLLRASDSRRADFATEQADALALNLARITFKVADTAGIKVTDNGTPIASSSWGVPLPVDPITHHIEAAAPGYVSWKKTVEVTTQSAAQTIVIPALKKKGASGGSPAPKNGEPPLVPSPTPGAGADTGPNPLVITGAVMAALGGGSMIVGGIFGGMVLGDAEDARNDPALCPEERCTDAGLVAIDDAKSKATVADIMLVGGGALAALGTTLLVIGIVAGDDDGAEGAGADAVQLRPSLGPGGGFVSLSLRF